MTHQRGTGDTCRSDDLVPQQHGVGVTEIHMHHFGAWFFAEGGNATPGVIDQLVRAGQHARTECIANAAHRIQRQYARGADILQCRQVGAVVDQVRWYRMAFAMPRQEGHALAEQRADTHRPGRFAESRLDFTRLHVPQVGQFVDASAANHCQRDIAHAHSFSA